MRLNNKGQVTIPAELRHRHDLHPGDEVEVIEEGDTLQIRRRGPRPTPGERAVSRLRASATTDFSTDELMALLRGD